MIRAKCPKCTQILSLEDAAAGSVASCPHCGQKFRVPGAKKPAAAEPPKPKPARPAPPQAKPKPAVEEVVDGGYGVMAASDLPPPPKVETGPMPLEFRMMEERAREEAEGDEDEEPEEEVVRRPKKKKKKKAKKPTQLIPGMSNAHLAGLAGGLVAVALICLLAFWIFKKATAPEPTLPPEVVIKEIQGMGGRVVRDNTPEQNVIEVNLTGSEAQGEMLSKLRAFPKLEKLNLSGTKVSDAHVGHFPALKSVRVLNLSRSKVASGIEDIAKMPNLEELDLSGTLVLENLLAPLKECKKLRKLVLNGCTFADGRSLRGVMPNLEIIRD
jgi:Leucine-rich repeat (LRR) protein